jgi:hypothetical protein
LKRSISGITLQFRAEKEKEEEKALVVKTFLDIHSVVEVPPSPPPPDYSPDFSPGDIFVFSAVKTALNRID